MDPNDHPEHHQDQDGEEVNVFGSNKLWPVL
jgi:hypothetical protein